jgi:hypothetical protein
MTTALQRIRWCLSFLSPRADLTESNDIGVPLFCVLVGLLAVCVVLGGLELIGAI